MSTDTSKIVSAKPPAAEPAGRGSLPRVIREPAAMRHAILAAREAGQTVGLVPTMGALHEGHLSLVDASRAECDLTAVTVFVNPMQFGPQEDFARYPRDLEGDLAGLGRRGCGLVFTPEVDHMYPPGHATTVDVGPVSQPWEGALRPVHFAGVATVVLKLFQIVPADRAYFGHKDYQQTIVVRQMVRDLNVPIEVRVCPTVREPDGLAMSSRNAYLSPDERRRALVLSRSLRLAEQLASGGERDAAAIRHKMQEEIDRVGGVDIQYIALVAEGTVTPVDEITGPTVVALAAKVGQTRLIDNTVLHA